MLTRAAALPLVLLSACGDDATIVSVAARPTVHPATRLKVTLTIGGRSSDDELSLGSRMFPGSIVDFSFSAPDQTGDVEIQVDALDAAGLVVGRGVSTVPVGTASVDIMMEGADFVVNTSKVGDQFPSDDEDANGYQLTAMPNGTWTIAFRDTCATSCDMVGRRFSRLGIPESTTLGGGGTNEFKFSATQTTSISVAAMATANNRTIAVWDTATGIACRAIDQEGAAASTQQQLGTDVMPDVVAIAPLTNNTFAVTWGAFIGGRNVVRSMIISPDCTQLTTPVTSSVSSGTTHHRPSVASSGAGADKLLYGWILDGTVHVRPSNNLNIADSPSDQQFLPKTSLEQVEYVRVAPAPAGFAVFARYAEISQMGAGRIDLYRADMLGTKMGGATLIADTTGADSVSAKSFGVATGPDGSMMVVWHACGANGDDDGCGVFGRFIGQDFQPVGTPFVVATTTKADQTNPSVVGLGRQAGLPPAYAIAWRDQSMAPTDTSGAAVRARILFFPE